MRITSGMIQKHLMLISYWGAIAWGESVHERCYRWTIFVSLTIIIQGWRLRLLLMWKQAKLLVWMLFPMQLNMFQIQLIIAPFGGTGEICYFGGYKFGTHGCLSGQNYKCFSSPINLVCTYLEGMDWKAVKMAVDHFVTSLNAGKRFVH